jgi:hypothetical protein
MNGVGENLTSSTTVVQLFVKRFVQFPTVLFSSSAENMWKITREAERRLLMLIIIVLQQQTLNSSCKFDKLKVLVRTLYINCRYDVNMLFYKLHVYK